MRIVQPMAWHDIAKTRAKALKITQDDIAEWLGVTRGAVGHYLAGRREPTLEQLKKVAAGLRLTMSELLGEVPTAGLNVRERSPDEALDDDEVLIKETRVKFSAGPGHKPTFELIEESEPASYRRSWFQKERLNPTRCIRYRVTNDSQEPFLFSGDSILVNLDETRVMDGKTYALRYGDELRVKKLYKRVNGLTLESWNDKLYPPETLSPDQVDDHITIIGRVRDKSGRGGL